jgi:hypothetical protein
LHGLLLQPLTLVYFCASKINNIQLCLYAPAADSFPSTERLQLIGDRLVPRPDAV